VIAGLSIGRSFGEEESDRKPQKTAFTKKVSCRLTKWKG
jgi:hypothetical protein